MARPESGRQSHRIQGAGAWPKTLTKKWSVTVGDGVATPALVDGKLYVISRQSGDDVIRCLDAMTGKEVWQDKYPARTASGAASSFPGPRASPTVEGGKVVTLGADGMLSCYDAATGKKVWQKSDFKRSIPRFFTSCSPLVTDGICIVQLGGERGGSIYAFDLATGAQEVAIGRGRDRLFFSGTAEGWWHGNGCRRDERKRRRRRGH